MVTMGGEISGYWAMGRMDAETSPAMTRMIANTDAKMGRSMKNLDMDLIRCLPSCRCCYGLAGCAPPLGLAPSSPFAAGPAPSLTAGAPPPQPPPPGPCPGACGATGVSGCCLCCFLFLCLLLGLLFFV